MLDQNLIKNISDKAAEENNNIQEPEAGRSIEAAQAEKEAANPRAPESCVDAVAIALLKESLWAPTFLHKKMKERLSEEVLKAHLAFNDEYDRPGPNFQAAYQVWRDIVCPPSDKGSTANSGNGNSKPKRKSTNGPNREQNLTAVPFNEIIAVPLKWLWPGVIARGKLTVIAGHPGLGKSQITAWIASIVSTGGEWPSGSNCDQGSVLFICAEDDAGDTIKPRLEACGAAMERNFVLRDTAPLSLKSDLDALAEKIDEISDLRLVVVDPISAYLGGTDSHNNADVRGLLARLSELAERTGIAFVAITHLNKTQGGKAVERVTGSLAFVAAARAAFLVDEHKDDPEKRVFLPIKINIARKPKGRIFHIESISLDSDIETSRIVWGGETDLTADDALGDQEAQDKVGALDEAAEFLRKTLADGPMPVKKIMGEMILVGISRATLRRAKERLKLDSKKRGSEWVWMPPEDIIMESNDHLPAPQP